MRYTHRQTIERRRLCDGTAPRSSQNSWASRAGTQQHPSSDLPPSLTHLCASHILKGLRGSIQGSMEPGWCFPLTSGWEKHQHTEVREDSSTVHLVLESSNTVLPFQLNSPVYVIPDVRVRASVPASLDSPEGLSPRVWEPKIQSYEEVAVIPKMRVQKQDWAMQASRTENHTCGAKQEIREISSDDQH